MRTTFLIAALASILVSQPATAQQYQRILPGNKPAQGESPQAADMTLGAAELFAVVSSAGALARGAGAVSSTAGSNGTGTYNVKFNRNIRNCVYIATLGDPGSSVIPVAGQIGVTGDVNDVQSVFIVTRDQAGTVANRGFMLKVSCIR